MHSSLLLRGARSARPYDFRDDYDMMIAAAEMIGAETIYI